MVNQKKNKNVDPHLKSLLDLGSGANFFLPMVNQKRLRLRGVEGTLYRHASEGILSSLSPPLSRSLFFPSPSLSLPSPLSLSLSLSSLSVLPLSLSLSALSLSLCFASLVHTCLCLCRCIFHFQ